MKRRGGGEGEGGETGDKTAEGQKNRWRINLPPYFLVCDIAFIFVKFIVAVFLFSDVWCSTHPH